MCSAPKAPTPVAPPAPTPQRETTLQARADTQQNAQAAARSGYASTQVSDPRAFGSARPNAAIQGGEQTAGTKAKLGG
jgi:hypothetical protein